MLAVEQLGSLFHNSPKIPIAQKAIRLIVKRLLGKFSIPNLSNSVPCLFKNY
jgi:hypothetical protein